MMKEYTIYTDGAYKTKSKIGAWAAIVVCNDQIINEICGVKIRPTSNQMEILAAIRGLESLEQDCQVEILTDSQYVQKAMSVWINRWKVNGWLTADKREVANRELFERLDFLASKHLVKWNWVRGHNGNTFNERADQLCNLAVQDFILKIKKQIHSNDNS